MTLRFTQLNAHSLNDDLVQLFKRHLSEIVGLGCSVAAWAQPELNAMLQAALVVLPAWATGQTMGHRLFGLRYASRQRLTLALVALCVAQYAKERVLPLLSVSRHAERALHAVCSVLSLLNYVAFLYSGRFATLVERAVSCGATSEGSGVRYSQLDYFFVTKDLVLQTAVDTVQALLPLARGGAVQRLWQQWQNRQCGGAPTDRRLCGLCRLSLVQPHGTGCAHVYCFLCIAASFDDHRFVCPVCQHSSPALHFLPPRLPVRS